jgi:hypothetical protein
MSRYRGVSGRWLAMVALVSLAGCTGSAPGKPGDGGAGTSGAAGNAGSTGQGGGTAGTTENPDAATTGTAGTGGATAGAVGTAGTAGSGAAGAGTAGTAAAGTGAAGTGAAGTGAAGTGAAGTGAAGTGAAGTGAAGTGAAGTGAAGTSACGDVGQPCCTGSTCGGNLLCLNGTTCSCAKALFGNYLLRTDGAVLAEQDPPSTVQTPVLDGTTGLPLVGITGVQDGARHGCAVQASSHTAWCWRTGAGGNEYGQLGIGVTDTLTTSYQATQVLTAANTPLANVTAIATTEQPGAYNGEAACAVTSEGKLYCWGTLSYLTNGGTALVSPFAVPITTDGVTPFTGVLQVGVYDSGAYACAIVQGSAAKELWCWGINNSGYLGLGDQTLRRYPTKVLGISNPIKVLAQEYYGTTCVLDGSNVRCWGENVYGEVGNGISSGNTGSVVLSPSLVTLMGGTTALGNIVDLHGGDASSYSNFCGLTTTNTLVCWGYLYQPYPTDFAISNVVELGGTGSLIRYVTGDGLYHHGTMANHVGTTRVPNCGPLH